MKRMYPVVCVGASAGGLEALIALVSQLPGNIYMAFVLIQHLEPKHKSLLSEILARDTGLTIREAHDNTKVEPGHIYVIPPDSYLAISDKTLRITPRTKHPDGTYLPIDYFMFSLAKDLGDKAIGVILSGTGSDGTLGAEAIKAKGGLILAQDQKTAKYFGMPQSAISSGTVDFVLGPKAIADKLVEIGSHPDRSFVKRPGKAHLQLREDNALDEILFLLRDLTGVDMVHYKRTTVIRRIARQMAFRKIARYRDYLGFLRTDPAEARILYQDILIPVTTFFRDPELFSSLKNKVFPFIARNRSAKDPIKIWVPACSSGEEVYSIAICMREFLEGKKVKAPVIIFGTDVSETRIEKARSSLFTEDISAHVSSERLRRFFSKTERGYKIGNQIRESGFLVLGTSESTGSLSNLFTVVDKKYKIYSNKIAGRRLPLDYSAPSDSGPKPEADKGRRTFNKMMSRDLDTAAVEKRRQTGPVKKKGARGERSSAQLEKDLEKTEKRLQAIIEEKDTFNEELRAANEEIQSSNEELQSMNEELETSKEELQSTNEELVTLNEELQNRNAELFQLNSDLSNVFSSTSIPMIIVGSDLRIRRFTPMARKMMNVIDRDAGRPIGDIKLNIEIPDLESMIADVIESINTKETEVRDSEGRWYSVRIRPYRTIDNKIDGAVIMMIDIDAVRRSQSELKDALDYAQAITDTMSDAFLVLDKDLCVLTANQAFYRVFKLLASDVEKHLIYELGGRQWDVPRLRELLEDILPRKTHFENFEVSADFLKIGERVMELSARQIYSQGKEKQMILLNINDITELKRAEEVLHRDKDALEKIVQVKSRELTESHVELEKAGRLSDIGTLAATVAHELRNPLAAIKMAALNIKRKAKNRDIDKQLLHIEKKIDESDQIINNLLFYARLNPPHYESIHIADVIKECVELSRKQNNKIIRITAAIDPVNDILIDADPIQVKEVLSNLLNNARDAVPADKGKINIFAENEADCIRVVIVDNGAGIENDSLGKIFDPFFTTKAKGTGLGLSVCKQILNIHEGGITVKSKSGHGTSVVVTLPKRKNKWLINAY